MLMLLLMMMMMLANVCMMLLLQVNRRRGLNVVVHRVIRCLLLEVLLLGRIILPAIVWLLLLLLLLLKRVFGELVKVTGRYLVLAGGVVTRLVLLGSAVDLMLVTLLVATGPKGRRRRRGRGYVVQVGVAQTVLRGYNGGAILVLEYLTGRRLGTAASSRVESWAVAATGVGGWVQKIGLSCGGRVRRYGRGCLLVVVTRCHR